MIVNGTRRAIQKRNQSLQVEDSAAPGVRRSHAASLLDFFSSGAERWHKDFDVTMTREGDRLFVHLKPWQTPTSTSQGVDHIVTTLQLPGYEVVEIQVVVEGNNQISYQFAHIKRNVPMADDLFVIPAQP